MNKKAIAILSAAAIVCLCAYAVVWYTADGDESTGDTYGTPTKITIMPGGKYTYSPSFPSDLSVSTTIALQKSGSTAGTNVSIATFSSNTLIVQIPTDVAAGTTYHVVLKHTSTNPSQTAYTYIEFDVAASLTVTASQSNVVVGSTVNITPVASGMGTIAFSSSNLPSGLTIDSSTGKITGTVSSIGTISFVITATSSYGEVATVTVSFLSKSALVNTSSPTNGVIVYAG